MLNFAVICILWLSYCNHEVGVAAHRIEWVKIDNKVPGKPVYYVKAAIPLLVIADKTENKTLLAEKNVTTIRSSLKLVNIPYKPEMAFNLSVVYKMVESLVVNEIEKLFRNVKGVQTVHVNSIGKGTVVDFTLTSIGNDNKALLTATLASAIRSGTLGGTLQVTEDKSSVEQGSRDLSGNTFEAAMVKSEINADGKSISPSVYVPIVLIAFVLLFGTIVVCTALYIVKRRRRRPYKLAAAKLTTEHSTCTALTPIKSTSSIIEESAGEIHTSLALTGRFDSGNTCYRTSSCYSPSPTQSYSSFSSKNTVNPENHADE